MPEEERLRLTAIAERIALVRAWTQGMGEVEFLADMQARDAVAMSLLIIGETARRLTDDTDKDAPNSVDGHRFSAQSHRPRL
jgi:uncharacterized protein with HEPN domain